MSATVADAVPLATNIAVTARVGRDHSSLEVADSNAAVADQAPSPPIESASAPTSPAVVPEANSQGDQAISVQADKPAAVAPVDGVTVADAAPSQPSQIEPDPAPAPAPAARAADQEFLQPKNNASATTSPAAVTEADSQGDQAISVQADKPAAVAPVEGITVADAAPSQPSQIEPAPDPAAGAAGRESLLPKNNASATTSPAALPETNSPGGHPTAAKSDQSVAAATLAGAVVANAAPPQLSPPRSASISRVGGSGQSARRAHATSDFTTREFAVADRADASAGQCAIDRNEGRIQARERRCRVTLRGRCNQCQRPSFSPSVPTHARDVLCSIAGFCKFRRSHAARRHGSCAAGFPAATVRCERASNSVGSCRRHAGARRHRVGAPVLRTCGFPRQCPRSHGSRQNL